MMRTKSSSIASTSADVSKYEKNKFTSDRRRKGKSLSRIYFMALVVLFYALIAVFAYEIVLIHQSSSPFAPSPTHPGLILAKKDASTKKSNVRKGAPKKNAPAKNSDAKKGDPKMNGNAKETNKKVDLKKKAAEKKNVHAKEVNKKGDTNKIDKKDKKKDKKKEKQQNDKQKNKVEEAAQEEVTPAMANAACAKKKKKAFCIQDVLATGDIDMAEDPFY